MERNGCDFTVTSFVSPLLKSNMYFLQNGKHAIVIDPFWNSTVEIIIGGITIDYCLITHEHYDHISGINRLKEKHNCIICCSESCAERIKNPRDNAARYLPAFSHLQVGETPPDLSIVDINYRCRADLVYKNERTLHWHNHTVFLKSTPGHSPGSSCILVDQTILFTGDSLLKNGKVQLRFPGGDPVSFQKITLPFLKTLPSDTLVYPGHYDSFLLKDVKL